MTFKIFKKTGEYHDRNGDWDGDEGYYVEIEVPDEEVNNALQQIIFNCYFRCVFPYNEHYYDTNVERMKERIGDFISDCELEETMKEYFADELKEWVQKEYGNG